MKRRILQQAMYLLCISFVISPCNLYAKTRTTKDTPGTAIFVMANTSPITVLTKHIVHQSDIINLDIKVPQIKGLSDKKFEKQLNKSFLNEALAHEKEALRVAREYNKEILQDQLTPLKFEYLSSYTLINAPTPYFVIEFLDYQYSGGAHGISYQKYVTIDTDKNKIVALKDLFKENTDYKQSINAEINKQIKERTSKGEIFFTGSQGFVGIKDDQVFYINALEDIVIVFNLYEIAPYAAGVIEFALSRKSLESYLK